MPTRALIVGRPVRMVIDYHNGARRSTAEIIAAFDSELLNSISTSAVLEEV